MFGVTTARHNNDNNNDNNVPRVDKPAVNDEEDDMVIDAVHGVYKKGGIRDVDYDKLLDRFGCAKIDMSVIERIERIDHQRNGQNRPAHPFLRRGLFYAHRDLIILLDAIESGEKDVYLYTGRGPSAGSMHIGHLVPFAFTKYLQDALGAPVLMQLTDDEKFLTKGITREEIERYTVENAKDIIACGFDPEKTFICSDFDNIGTLYPAICTIQRELTIKQVANTFGIKVGTPSFDAMDEDQDGIITRDEYEAAVKEEPSNSVGRIAFPPVQMAPSFASTFPEVFGGHPERFLCLIPCGIDQDKYFMLVRDIATRLHEPKPAVIHSKFLPALTGIDSKMSTTAGTGGAENVKHIEPIFLTDTLKQVKKKMSQAFSGGRETLEEQRLGADLTVDVPFQLLEAFLEDDHELKHVEEFYGSGKGSDTLQSGQVKEMAARTIFDIIARHQAAKAKVTDEVLRHFMTMRPLVAKVAQAKADHPGDIATIMAPVTMSAAKQARKSAESRLKKLNKTHAAQGLLDELMRKLQEGNDAFARGKQVAEGQFEEAKTCFDIVANADMGIGL